MAEQLTLKTLSEYYAATHKSTLEAAKDLLIDRFAKITDKTFNDQPIGRSKPVLTGKVALISGVHLCDGKIYVRLEGIRHYMNLSQLEIEQ